MRLGAISNALDWLQEDKLMELDLSEQAGAQPLRCLTATTMAHKEMIPTQLRERQVAQVSEATAAHESATLAQTVLTTNSTTTSTTFLAQSQVTRAKAK